MDHTSFDRITRLLGGAATRRAGIGAVVTALASASFAGDIAARSRHVKPEGPCGDHKKHDNVCTKDSQCCTGYCKKGIKNKDGKGRCRCVKRGKACTEDKNCCHSLPCTNGTCGSSGPTPVPDICTVCATGCAYTTVADAVAGEAAGATIKIDTGTYDADLVIGKDVTLTNCNGSAVTLRNLTAGGRTIVFDPAAQTLPTLTITNLTITKSDGEFDDGGGIAGVGHLVLDGTTIIEKCRYVTQTTTGEGGGIQLGDASSGDTSSIVIQGDTIIRQCTAGSGGGLCARDNVKTVEIRGNAKFTANEAVVGNAGGGGMYLGDKVVTTISGTVVISGNNAAAKGGGIYDYGYADSVLTIAAGVSVTGNNAVTGGGIYKDDPDGAFTVAPGTVTGNNPTNCAGDCVC